MGSLDSSIVGWKAKVQGEVDEKAKYRLDLKLKSIIIIIIIKRKSPNYFINKMVMKVYY